MNRIVLTEDTEIDPAGHRVVVLPSAAESERCRTRWRAGVLAPPESPPDGARCVHPAGHAGGHGYTPRPEAAQAAPTSTGRAPTRPDPVRRAHLAAAAAVSLRVTEAAVPLDCIPDHTAFCDAVARDVARRLVGELFTDKVLVSVSACDRLRLRGQLRVWAREPGQLDAGVEVVVP